MQRRKPNGPFKNGHKKFGGRKKGTPNKFTGQIKDLTVDTLVAKGDYLRTQYERYCEQELELSRKLRRAKAKGRATGSIRKDLERMQDLVFEYEQYACGGAMAAMLQLYNKEPNAYLQIIAKLLPMQIQGKFEGEVSHRYETVEEVEAEMRRRNLPVPPRMIDVTPIKTERKAA